MKAIQARYNGYHNQPINCPLGSYSCRKGTDDPVLANAHAAARSARF